MRASTADLITRARLRMHAAEPSANAWRVRNNEVDPDNPQGDLFVGGGSLGSFPIMIDGTHRRASDIAWFLSEAPMLIRRLCEALESVDSGADAS